ncbi:MAG: hypothetical protein GXO43_07165, partial [Crenarchaeota archaeon]|nr:hypothetical protein [Thermoproteota archaeon]
MMRAPTSAPYPRDVLLIYKLLSLLHDPPFKPYFLGRGHERIAIETGEPILCLAQRPAIRFPDLYRYLDKVIEHRNIDPYRFLRSYRGRISVPVPKRADFLASAFDRYLFDHTFACTGDRGPSLGLCGLTNIFLPCLGFLKHIGDDSSIEIRRNLLKESAMRTIYGISCALKDALCSTNSMQEISREWILYSFFSYLYEPEMYMGLRDYVVNIPNDHSEITNYVCPADTRVPHHSIFDHLYASATAANMVSKSYKVYSFILVRLSLKYIKDWLSGSRKLSDLWFSSWMIGAWIWYMVEELVDKYGPDILVYPEMRWNQHFSSHLYTVLKDLENHENLKEHVDRVAEKIYWLDKDHPFPHYAWLPAQVYLVIPVVHDPIGSDETRRNNTLLAQMHALEKYLIKRYTEFWNKIIGIIIDNNESGEAGDVIKHVLEEIKDKPPLPMKMTLIGIYHKRDDHERGGLGGIFLRHIHIYCGENDGDCIDTVIEEHDISPEDLIGRIEHVHGWEVLVKLLYTVAFWLSEIIDRYSEPRLRPPNTIRYIPRNTRGGNWRHCSVCRHGVAVIHAPINQDDYRVFAQQLGLNMENPEKIIKPGERLCPYCLFKRLAGTIEKDTVITKFFPHIKGADDIDVYFPATDDVAGLAHKLGLVETITIIAENTERLGGDKILKEILEQVKAIVGKTRNKRILAPWLLARAVENMERALKDKDREDLTKMIVNLVSEPLFDLLDDEEKREKYEKLISILVKALKTLKSGEASREIKSLYDDLQEALKRPRTNYAIVYFDADIVSKIMTGLLPQRIGIRDQEYLDTIIYSELLGEAVEETMKNAQDQGEIIRYSRILATIAKSISELLAEILDSDERVPATLLTSPSYHRAVSNAILHFMYKAATAALILGSLPVYMGGDNGLVIMPSWLPLRIAAYAVSGDIRIDMLKDILLPYRELVESILEERVKILWDRLEDPCSPPLLYVYLLRKIYWGSASKSHPAGFLPVTEKPRLFTDPIYYIPAIIVSGLSIGVKHAHYKDHMYYELVGAMNLSAYSKMMGGDNLSVMYGRAPTPVALRSPRRIGLLGGVETIRMSTDTSTTCLIGRTKQEAEKLIRSAGDVLGAALLLDTLVQKKVLSRSFYSDIETMLGEKGLVPDKTLWTNLLYRMTQRNLALRRAGEALLRLDILGRIAEVISMGNNNPLN